MNKELKPCPFCGEQPDIETGKGDNVWITCGCGASVASIVSDDDAIDGWNTRAYESELQSLQAENERLEEEIEHYKNQLDLTCEEGLTPADAKKLKKFNHDLAHENSRLRYVLELASGCITDSSVFSAVHSILDQGEK